MNRGFNKIHPIFQDFKPLLIIMKKRMKMCKRAHSQTINIIQTIFIKDIAEKHTYRNTILEGNIYVKIL
jgi:hypothetical protein